METTRIRIGPRDHGRRMTLDEFWDAEETPGCRYELARGVLEVTEVPNDDHGQIVHNLHEEFSLYLRAHPGLIRRIAHGSDIRLLIPELGSDRNPDLALVFFDAPLNHRGRQIPALVVEIVSPGARAHRRDYEEKREEYLALGIREYWVVDPSRKTVMVLVRRDGEPPAWEERVSSGDDPIVSASLPGLDARVSALWADAEPPAVEADEPD
jgi:Uma2 family endonuclease